MDASLYRLVQAVKKRVPMAISVAMDETIADKKALSVLTEAVKTMPLLIDIIEVIEAENVAMRRELLRLHSMLEAESALPKGTLSEDI